MKHIVVVTTSFPDISFKPGQEAAGMFVTDFVRELANYTYVTIVAPGSQDNIESFENFSIHRFAVPSLPLSLLQPASPAQWHKIIKTLQAGRRSVQKAVSTRKTDHIFALWALPSGYWAHEAGEKYHIPYSIWALGSDIWRLGKIPIIRTVLRNVLQNSQVCFADGYQLANDVEAISSRKCHFLPSSRKLSVPSTKNLAVEPPYNLAFLGRWHPNKGIDLLLESLFLLGDADWKRITAVRIYGGGPLENLVHSQVNALKALGYSVEIGGYLNREDATNLLIWADYLLLPSRIESIPIIFSDAMQANCLLISTPIGDLPRLIHKYNVGILADAVTPYAQANAIRYALKHPPATFSTQMQTVATEFDMSTIVPKFLNHL